jgi:hypothetical protein
MDALRAELKGNVGDGGALVSGEWRVVNCRGAPSGDTLLSPPPPFSPSPLSLSLSLARGVPILLHHQWVSLGAGTPRSRHRHSGTCMLEEGELEGGGTGRGQQSGLVWAG